MRRSTREAKLKIVMKIMVFSGSVGPHPDCNFAFKFPINQSIFYRFPTVAGNTLFNMYINFIHILISLQGLIDQIYICTPAQISTGTCNEMSGPSRAGVQPARRSTISVACRPASVFSGNFFKTPSPWPMTPARRYEVAAANAAATTAAANAACKRNNMKVSINRSHSTSDLHSGPDIMGRLNGSLSLLDIPNTDSTHTLTPTAVPAPVAPRGTHNNSTKLESMDTNTTTAHLSTNYYQTRNARRAMNNHTTHNLDNGTICTSPHSTTGNFDSENNIQHLYLASRNNQQSNMHQNIACSFDPGNKICISCNTPHNILKPLSNAPLIFTLSDQSFPGTLSGGEGHCFKSVRIEDGNLTEITDLFFEMLQGGGAAKQ